MGGGFRFDLYRCPLNVVMVRKGTVKTQRQRAKVRPMEALEQRLIGDSDEQGPPLDSVTRAPSEDRDPVL